MSTKTEWLEHPPVYDPDRNVFYQDFTRITGEGEVEYRRYEVPATPEAAPVPHEQTLNANRAHFEARDGE